MEVSGHTPATVYPQEMPLVTTEQKADSLQNSLDTREANQDSLVIQPIA
jgi:hypothetical protein